jgi:xanthine phosphoribosyltransferase
MIRRAQASAAQFKDNLISRGTAMDLLRERILKEGKHLGKGVLKVDSFMNHQIDPMLMKQVGEEFARRFAHVKATRILTAETSGIVPAVATGLALNLPVVFARKHKPITMAEATYRQESVSPTHGKNVELIVSAEYMHAGDRVLIIDDFLATARTIIALCRLVEQSGATLVGVGAVIEKSFQNGRAVLSELTVPIESLGVIERFDGETIVLAEEVAVK